MILINYLTDDHAPCHGEPGAGREVWGDHDAQAGLREGQLVGVVDEKLVHHNDWRRLLTCEDIGISAKRIQAEDHYNILTFVPTFAEKHHRGIASRGVLSHLAAPVILCSRATWLNAPELTCHKHQNLGVEPASI